MSDKKEKRYSLSKEEQEEIKKLEKVYEFTLIQLHALKTLRDMKLAQVEDRVGLLAEQVPDTISRTIRLDKDTLELVVSDMPIIPQKETIK